MQAGPWAQAGSGAQAGPWVQAGHGPKPGPEQRSLRADFVKIGPDGMIRLIIIILQHLEGNIWIFHIMYDML